MPDVKHMKWWGWGVEGVRFHHEDKPAFRPFLIKIIDLDVNTPPMSPNVARRSTIPAPMISDQLLAELTDVVGADNAYEMILTDCPHVREERARLAADTGRRHSARTRCRGLSGQRSLCAAPRRSRRGGRRGDHSVRRGTSFSGSLSAPEDETRPVISVDLGRMSRVIEIDEESGLPRIQAGAQGPDLEEQLGEQGWALGHCPDSFTHSTLDGWVAARSSGMQSDKYGDFSDIARGMRHARQGAGGTAHPRHVNGPERTRDGARLGRSAWA
jgi:alkyldihydroxyacetonephosphate synthase